MLICFFKYGAYINGKIELRHYTDIWRFRGLKYIIHTFIKKMQDKKYNTPNEENKGEELTPHQLANKHMQDKDHIITDEDIKNTKIGVQEPEEEAEMKRTLDEVEKNEEQHKDYTNPYDLIDDDAV
jgi:hypothetical protein